MSLKIIYKKSFAIIVGVVVFFTATNLCAQKTEAANLGLHEHGEHSSSSTVSPCCFTNNESTIDVNLQSFSIGKVFINTYDYYQPVVINNLSLRISKQTIIPPPELFSIKKTVLRI